jgi:hypothetical protein
MSILVRRAHADRFPIRLIWVIAATTLVSCESVVTEIVGEEPLPAVTISIRPNASTLLVGEVAYLSAILRNSQGRDVSAVVEWSSANPSVAAVGRTSGNVTAVGVGSTTVTVSSQGLVDTATITVLTHHPAAHVRISPVDELILNVGGGQRLSAVVVDAQGRFTPAPFEWTSENPGVATIGRTDGQITGVAVGSTTLTVTAGLAFATIAVQVVPQDFLMQWASTATASSEFTAEGNGYFAAQATGSPNVTDCGGQAKMWLSASPDVDWLELQYPTPVRPSEIRIYEVWAPGLTVKVEMKDTTGAYHTVYTASPKLGNDCMRTLSIPITNFTEPVSAVRVTLDQRDWGEWSGIDAVRLVGYRIN